MAKRLNLFSVYILISLCFILLFQNSLKAHEVLKDHDKVRIKLKWLHQFQFAGYYAAHIKGYYKEHGLEVEMIEGNAKSYPIKFVLSDSAEYGISASDIIESKGSGDPIVILAAIFQHSPYVIISQKDKNITQPRDLIGKKLMASSEQGYVQLKAMLKKQGINISTINIINHTWNNQDITNGHADAMTGYISAEPYQLSRKGVDINLIKPINYGIDFYGDMLFTTQKEIDDHPKRAKAIREATIKGWEYAITHMEEICDYILTLPGVKERGLTKEHLMYEALTIQALVKPELVEIGHVNKKRLEQMIENYKIFSLIEKDINVDELVYEEQSEKKYNELLNIVYYLIALIILTAILIFIWNRQLQKTLNKKTLELQKEIEIRKDAEMSAKQSEERLELALEAARLGIWDSYLKTGYVYRNRIWAEMLGYDPHDISPDFDGWRKLVHPEDFERINTSINNHIKGLTQYDNYEHRLITSKGEWKWVLSLSKIVAHDENNNPTRLIGIHIDIDDLKKKEIQLKQITEELMYTNRELEKFAYITSHNLRAPVVNIVSLLEMFDKSSISNSDNLMVIDKINTSVKRLETTLNDLIEVVSAKKITLTEKTLVYISEVCKNVLSNLETQLIKVDAELKLDFSKADRIVYIKTVLESILQNLITNCIKYRSSERRLMIEITSSEDKNYVYLKVKDNGLGFDSEKFGDKIFRLYERLHYNIEGKGLGLYLIKSQIEALNGKIEVNSIPNEGTVFIVSIKKEIDNE